VDGIRTTDGGCPGRAMRPWARVGVRNADRWPPSPSDEAEEPRSRRGWGFAQLTGAGQDAGGRSGRARGERGRGRRFAQLRVAGPDDGGADEGIGFAQRTVAGREATVSRLRQAVTAQDSDVPADVGGQALL
jgi:hypothetical protein